MTNFAVRTALSLLFFQLIIGTGITLNALPAQPSAKPRYSTQTIGDSPKITPTPTPSSSPTPKPVRINDCVSATKNVNNGISITEIKPYDERTLYAQLQAYEESLAQTRYPDISPLYQNVNRLQGSEVRSSSMSVTGSTLPLPSIMTTTGNTANNSLTGSVTSGSTETTTVGADGTMTSTSGTTASTTGGTTSGTTNSYNQVVTQQAVSPNIPSATLSATGFPTPLTYDLSPQDTLDKYTALTYQILNLRSLLNQSYSDKLIAVRDQGSTDYRFESRVQAFLGFTVNIEPQFSDHVAEVEITIRNPQGPLPSGTPETPATPGPTESRLSVISLFPEEKTYNVAKITDDKRSFGAGATISIVNIGGAYSSSKNKLYLVRDTDVVAFQRDAPTRQSANGKFESDPTAISFVWQFKPVLGQKTVAPGLRKVFALVALPKSAVTELDANWSGAFSIRTRWRAQSGSGIVKDNTGMFERAKSLVTRKHAAHWKTNCEGEVVIPAIKNVENALQPEIWSARWHDNGNGVVTILAEGINFSNGTQVMLGNSVLDRPSNGLSIHSEKRLVITGQASAIAKAPPFVINRYGNTKLGMIRATSPNPYLSLENPTVEFKGTGVNETEVSLVLKWKTGADDKLKDLFTSKETTPPVVQIGDSIFGLSNAPFTVRQATKDDVTLTFRAPTDLLRRNSVMTVRELVNDASRIPVEYTPTDAKYEIFSVKSVQKLASDVEGTTNIKIALRGTGFDARTKVIAENHTFGPSTFEIATDTLVVLNIPKTAKKVFVTGGENGDLIAINLSDPEPFAKATIKDPVKLIVRKGDSKAYILRGAILESIKSIFFENVPITFEMGKDKLSIEIFIPSAITASTGEKQLTLVMKDDARVPFLIEVQ
ncbi:MAG: hypothetical protein KF855_13785 [Acidobacteria bacterium]|nr:hypothetical protein [Acidobacteriota bacterium]